jgi:hypothetical protein
VKEVTRIAIAAEKGLGMAYIDDQTPAVLTDALAVYLAARSSSHAHHLNAYHEEQRRKRQR